LRYNHKMPKITEIRKRVDDALTKLNEEQMTIASPAGDLVVTLASNRYRYDVETHLNADSKSALEAGIESFANDQIDEHEMKSRIAKFRDDSEIIYYDQRYLIYEPGVEDFQRLQARFALPYGERVIAKERTD